MVGRGEHTRCHKSVGTPAHGVEGIADTGVVGMGPVWSSGFIDVTQKEFSCRKFAIGRFLIDVADHFAFKGPEKIGMTLEHFFGVTGVPQSLKERLDSFHNFHPTGTSSFGNSAQISAQRSRFIRQVLFPSKPTEPRSGSRSFFYGRRIRISLHMMGPR